MAGDFVDAIALLKAEHRTLENLFATFAHSRDEIRRARLAERIRTQLKINAALEQEIFYPALGTGIEQSLLEAAKVGLDLTAALADAIDARRSDDGLEALRTAALRHFAAEERASDGLFARSRGAGIDLVALRDRLLARKEELTALVESGDPLPARPTAF